MTRTAVYLRISSDRDGDALGVDRQRQDCQARATREGWTVVGEYVDNDAGASSKSSKPRPEYARMIDDAKAGKLDVILAYSTSRLTRRPMEYEELIQLSERHGVKIRTIASGDDDLSTADGQFVARIKAAQDAAESARISERVSRKALANAQSGKFGGGRRPFGFEADGMTVREGEAEEIRKATRTILGGGSLRSIVRDLNDRGITTTTGRPWSSIAVRDLLKRPRNSGLVKYNPVERDDNGNRVTNRSADAYGPAAWDAIVSDDQRLAVVALLSDPRRRTSPGNQPSYLGSSVYVCGVCGGTMRTTASGNRATRYVCNGGKGSGPSHISRNVDKTDALVHAAVVEWLTFAIGTIKLAGEDTTTDVDPGWSELTAELSAIETRRKEIQADYADGYFDRAEFRTQMDRLKSREADVRDRMSSGPTVTGIAWPHIESPDDVAPAWQAEGIDKQRAFIRDMFTVTIRPTNSRGTSFDPESVEITPNAHPGQLRIKR